MGTGIGGFSTNHPLVIVLRSSPQHRQKPLMDGDSHSGTTGSDREPVVKADSTGWRSSGFGSESEGPHSVARTLERSTQCHWKPQRLVVLLFRLRKVDSTDGDGVDYSLGESLGHQGGTVTRHGISKSKKQQKHNMHGQQRASRGAPGLDVGGNPTLFGS